MYTLHIYDTDGLSCTQSGDTLEDLKRAALAELLKLWRPDATITADIYTTADLTAKNYPRPIWRASFDIFIPTCGQIYL